MEEYNRTHRQIPSLSQAATQVAEAGPRKAAWNDFSAFGNWFRGGVLGFKGEPHPHAHGHHNYTHEINDEETILDGLLTVSLRRGDIIAVPEGKMDFLPEKYRHRAIEVKYCSNFAVIR